MIKIFKGINELSQYAARTLIEIANKSIEERGRFTAALCGGGTPARIYELLGDQFQNEVDWKHVHFFWGDERCVPVDDPGNNYGQVKISLLDKISIPGENVHRILSELGPEPASKDYAHTLKAFSEPPLAWPRFDLVFLGMGEDGHTASLFPRSLVDTDLPTLAVTAHYQDRPANRVTLTPKVLNSSRNIFFLAAGQAKAVTLGRVLNGEYSPLELPAQRIAPKNGNLTWLIDEEAGSFLK